MHHLDNEPCHRINHHTNHGQAAISLYAQDGHVWMNQNQLAELFDTSVPNISVRTAKILKDNDFIEKSVVKNDLTAAAAELDGLNVVVKALASQKRGGE